MVLAGMSWITVANSVTISAQMALPDWVRARGMAIYQMAIMGSSAFGAMIWGRIAEWRSVPVSLGCAAVSMLVMLVLTRGRPLAAAEAEDHTPTHPWTEPVPVRDIDPSEGPVMVTFIYLVETERREAFERVMAASRGSRLQQGAVSWGLFEDVQATGRYVEYFAFDTWADYLRRFDRFTAMDERLQEERFSFHIGEERPRVARYIAKHPSVDVDV